ncbi:MAG TPA: type II toxin-antitoxin system VapC family toxin [Thermoanaerobaculia bacterium]|nr:type II toxin-antitoxin system VapC family toxin [Thermoanaerobaculia bacterium]
MIAVDTNVLIRYLVEDDPRQAAEAARLIEAAAGSGEQIFIPQIVLCELVWVLSFAYEIPRRQIVSILQQLRRSAGIVIESADAFQRALASFESGKGDLADYLIAEAAMEHGCSAVATFDRALHADRRFVRPSAARG